MGWINVKKLILAVSLVSMFLTGCSKEVSNESFIEGLKEYNTNLSSYYSSVSLDITKDEEVIKFECEVYYLSEDYYKVIMKDLQTNNIQAIVKNEEGVTVLTPLLNKQFKFSNDWPLNSSHAYLFQAIVKDIANDEDVTVLKSDKDYVVTTTYNSKTNASLTKQKVTFNSSYKPLYCVVLNANEEVQMKATFNEFVDNFSLKNSDFNAEAITTSLNFEIGEGVVDYDIEDVVPTFATENKDYEKFYPNDDTVMYQYNGELNFTITCTEVEEDKVLTTYQTYDDVVLLTSGLGVYIDNESYTAVTFYQGNIQVTVYSDSLELEVLIEIANSF